jgi:hypothetical protein
MSGPVDVLAINDQMQSKLAAAGLPFESLKVFGVIRCNVHVVCASRDTAQKWVSLLSQVFVAQPSMTKHVWDAKHNKGTCLRPSKRKGWLVGVMS